MKTCSDAGKQFYSKEEVPSMHCRMANLLVHVC